MEWHSYDVERRAYISRRCICCLVMNLINYIKKTSCQMVKNKG